MLVAVGLLALLVQALLIGARSWSEYVPHYPTGALADRTVVTPVALRVLDPEATEIARAKEGRTVPPLFRFDAGASDLAVERFLKDYNQRHSLFLQGLRRRWPAPPSSDELASSAFADYLTAFQLAHPDFPLSDQMAASWATESDQDPLRNQTAAAIRNVLRQYVVADELPADTSHHADVYLSPPRDAGGVTQPDQLAERATRIQSRVMFSVSRARSQLRREVASAGPAWGDFAARFIAPNLTFDQTFTTTARTELTRDVNVYTEFQAGDPLVRAAHPVSEVQSAALQELRSHYATATAGRGWTPWWLGGVGLLLICGGVLTGMPGRTVIPAGARAGLAATTAGEAMALPLPLPEARSGLMNNLAAWLKLRFVQRLIEQRNEAMGAQAEASNQVEVLSDRLTKLHPEIRERVAEYERRIAQLEHELNSSNEVTRELIKTKISLARKELEIEKARSNLVWN